MTNDFDIDLKRILKEYGIAESDLLTIVTKLNFIEIKKKEQFLEAGTICKRLGILLNGLLMATFVTDSGKINVNRFFYSSQNIVVCNFESFKNRSISNESIIALEDSNLAFFTYEDLEELYLNVPAMQRIGREIAELSYINAMKRIYELQIHDTQTRVNRFFQKQPELFNRVNKNYLASYLRINRNDLSKALSKAQRK